jgi:hypothetical protein
MAKITRYESEQVDKAFAVRAAGLPLFQAAPANLNPWTEAKALTIDSGWREVADKALGFVKRFAQA